MFILKTKLGIYKSGFWNGKIYNGIIYFKTKENDLKYNINEVDFIIIKFDKYTKDIDEKTIEEVCTETKIECNIKKEDIW